MGTAHDDGLQQAIWVAPADLSQGGGHHTSGCTQCWVGPNGPISSVLIFNPYLVVREHYEAGHVNDTFFNSLVQRLIEIGAHDLGAPPDEEVKKPKAAVRRRRRRPRTATA